MEDIIKKTTKPAVGYLRVSTKGQAQNGIGLEGQRAAIEKFCELEGLDVVEWHQDGVSGMGDDNVAKREGLRRAISKARELRCPVIVNGLDRLARHSGTIERLVLDERFHVISTDGNTLTEVSIRSGAARAEAEGRAIGERTKQALEQKKANGILLGNRKNLDEAQRLGAAANRERAAAKANEIADHLEAIPGHALMNAREVVESLNSAGILSGSGKPWTLAAIRRPLTEAKKIIRDRQAAPFKHNPNYGRFG